MWSRSRVAAHGVAAVITLATAGCAGGDDEPDAAPVVQLGAPGETGRVVEPGTGSVDAGPVAADVDVAFMHDMIEHHRQALDMTALIADRTTNADLVALGARIDVAQTDEIGQMERWLTARDEAAMGEHADHASMPGMMTPAELDQLAAAEGTTFDTLFLQYMIRHHEGAIIMVQTHADQGGGQESEAFQISQHVMSDQSVEVSRMKSMLTAPPTTT